MADQPEKKSKKSKKIKLLFCLNVRGEGRRSCAASGAQALRKEAKAMTAQYPGIKVKKSGCLGLCKHGPVVEILPAKLYCQVRDADALATLMREAASDGPVTAGLIATGRSAKKK